MIYDLGTFIQFLSAIYFTITLDNMLCKRFWSPNYYSLIVKTIKRYSFRFSSIIQNKIELKIKNKANELEILSRKRGAYMLFVCVILLIYIGFENKIYETTYISEKVKHYFPIFSALLYITLTFILMNRTLKRWRYVILNMYMTILVLVVAHFVNTDFITNLFFKEIIINTKIYLIIILLFPVLYQLYINWLYSTAYRSYLNQTLTHEYELYQKARAALEKKDKKLCPDEYKTVFGDMFLDEVTKDQPITIITEHLNKRLDIIHTSSPIKIIQAHWKDKDTEYIESTDNLIDANNEITNTKSLSTKQTNQNKKLQNKSKEKNFPQKRTENNRGKN